MFCYNDFMTTIQLTLDDSLLTEAREIGRFSSPNETISVALQEYVQRHKPLEPKLTAFNREADAFERLLPTLFETHKGRYVAIHGGEVVGYGDEKFELLDQMREKLGRVAIYVGLVEKESPRTVRIVSNRVKR